MPRNLRWPVTALIVGAVGLAIPMVAVADNAPTNNKTFVYQVGLWGDLPYSAVQANPGVPNLIADMNSQDLAFSVHDGDLKAGNGATGNPPSVNCDNALYDNGLASLNQLHAPAMFTPGDNDWTDCDRPSNGGFNSLERLDHERQVFFSTPNSAGQKQLQQDVQSTPSCLGLCERPGHGPDDDQAGCVRREPAVDVQERHVCHAERPGLVQQPVRHRAEPRRRVGSERG